MRKNPIELVAEMRAGTSDDSQLPAKAVADQAVSAAIYGDRIGSPSDMSARPEPKRMCRWHPAPSPKAMRGE